MGGLDGIGVGCDEPAADERVEHRSSRRVGSELPAFDPLAAHLSFRRRADQPQKEVLGDLATLGRQAVEDAVGGARHRPSHAVCCPVPGGGQDTALAPLPCLGQRVREERKASWLAHHVGDDQVNESGLQAQTGEPGRPFDRGAQLGFAHGSEQVQAIFGPLRQLRHCHQVGDVVGADSQHDRQDTGPGADGCPERGSLLRVGALGEQLLELVDDQRRAREHLRDDRHRVHAGGDHAHWAAMPAEGGGDTCAGERGLA